jgi:predicted dehydrogenase
MLRIAVIGAGWAGTRHVEAMRELEAYCARGQELSAACTVAALVDDDADFLKAKAAELGVARTYVDYREALSAPDIDAVAVCLPHALHCPVTVEAARAGKHILVEKPIALNVAEATHMMQTAAEHGVKLYVAENECYAPMSIALRDLVQSGQYIGELTAATMINGFRAPNYGYADRRAWLSTPEQGGTGTWMLHGIHSMAQLRFVLGEVEVVYVQEHKAASFARTDVEATLSGLLTLAGGLHVSVLQTCETKLYGNLGGYMLHGDRGSVRASGTGYEIYDEVHDGIFVPYPADEVSSYAREYEAFAAYVAGLATGPTTAVSERRSLAVVEAGYASVHSGRPVYLQEYFGEL